ncbi:MAG: HdeD family acid-resistance protein [Pseudomonadota bacterium]
MALPEPQLSGTDIEKIRSDFNDAVRANWKAFLIEGIVFLVIGFAATVLPQLASVTVTILLGWMFLILGTAGIFLSLWARQMPGLWWSLVSAAIAIATGLILLIWPLEGTLSLTIVIGIYFLIEGIATIMYALDHKRELSGRWGWLLFAGIMDIIISAVIVLGLPVSAFWAVGVIVGINLMFGGVSLIGMALAARAELQQPPLKQPPKAAST